MKPTNLAEAEKLGMFVVMLPTNATELIELTRKGNEETHLETAEFIHEIRCGEWTFKLHCLAYKRHPGVIAADMKKRKEETCSD